MKIKEKLKKEKIETGDIIEIQNNNMKKQGILMPHHKFSDENTLTIKLENGYNIGLKVNNSTRIKLIKKQKKHTKQTKKIPYNEELPTISIISTGGTISSYIDYKTGAVHPATSSEEIAFLNPEIFEICNIKTKNAFQILSENIKITHWQKLAKLIADELNNGSKGVIIPHGTDTMGYTAAALSFMLKNLTGPVVLVGSQRSSDRPSSDAKLNLLNAAIVASKSDIGEVVIVMHKDTSDKITAINRGVRTKKFHTSRRDAFKTINEEPIGYVENNKIKLKNPYKKIQKGKVKTQTELEKEVSMIYYYPGLQPKDIHEKKGIVLIGTGLGHVSKDLITRLNELNKKGSVIIMTSQCYFGRTNLNVYSTGRELLKNGVVPVDDMLAETAYVKLMWALANSKDKQEAILKMKENIKGEMTKRTVHNSNI